VLVPADDDALAVSLFAEEQIEALPHVAEVAEAGKARCRGRQRSGRTRRQLR